MAGTHKRQHHVTVTPLQTRVWECASGVCAHSPHPGHDRAPCGGLYPEALSARWAWEGLDLSTDPLGQIILCLGVRPVYLSLLGTRSPALSRVTTREGGNVRRHCQVSPGRQNRLQWEPLGSRPRFSLCSRTSELASWASGIISVAAENGSEGTYSVGYKWGGPSSPKATVALGPQLLHPPPPMRAPAYSHPHTGMWPRAWGLRATARTQRRAWGPPRASAVTSEPCARPLPGSEERPKGSLLVSSERP